MSNKNFRYNNTNTDRIDSKLKREERMSFKNFVQHVKEGHESSGGFQQSNEVADTDLNRAKQKKFFGYDTKLNIESATVLNDGDCVRFGFVDDNLAEQFIYIDEGVWFDISELTDGETVSTLDRRGRDWRILREGTDVIFFDDKIDLEASASISALANVFSKVW